MPRTKKENMVMFKMLPDDIEKIKDGDKKADVREFYKDLEDKDVGLVNVETNKLELVITIGQVLSLKYLTEDEKDLMLDEAKVSQVYRDNYECNYMYLITDTKTVH
jgi:hypothetical protein